MDTDTTIPGFSSILNTSLSIKDYSKPVTNNDASHFLITNSFRHSSSFYSSNNIKLDPNLYNLTYNMYTNELHSKNEQKNIDPQRTLQISLGLFIEFRLYFTIVVNNLL